MGWSAILADTNSSSPVYKSASSRFSVEPVSRTLVISATNHSFFSPKISANGLPKLSSAPILIISSADLLRLFRFPVSSTVITPLDIL